MNSDIFNLPPPAASARVRYGPHPLQFGDLYLPSGNGPHPLVILIHGGFWRARFGLEHAGHQAFAFSEAGIAVWNIEYRRLDLDGGWPNTFLDAGAAADYLPRLAVSYPLDLWRAVALGHSAGGHLALWLGAQLPATHALHRSTPVALRALLAVAPLANLQDAWEERLGCGVVRDLLGGTPESVPDRYAAASPAALLPLDAPQVLIHGTRDDTIPVGMSRAYQAKAVSAGDECQLIALADTGHFEPIDPRTAAWREVLSAVQSTLGLAPSV